jgi:hypothetical protein
MRISPATLAPYDLLDVDLNGQASALQDGIMLVRHLSGVTGTDLTAGAIGANAHRTTPANLTSYLGQAMTSMLDVDANGQASALQDGIILVRFLSGVRGADLTAGALGAGAHRTDPTAIAAFLQSYYPVAVQSVQMSQEPTAPAPAAISPQAATLLDEPSALSDQLSAPDTALIADHVALLAAPAAFSSQPSALPNHSEPSTQTVVLDEGAAIAATQLARGSVQSVPWVTRFLAGEEDEDLVVTLSAS